MKSCLISSVFREAHIKITMRYHYILTGMATIQKTALAGVAQRTEHWPVKLKVTGSIPSQGTCLGCRPGPQLGACEREVIDVSHTWLFLSLSPSLPPSLK